MADLAVKKLEALIKKSTTEQEEAVKAIMDDAFAKQDLAIVEKAAQYSKLNGIR